MEQVQELFSQVIVFIQPIGQEIVSIFADIFGFSDVFAQWFLLVFIIYIIFVLVFRKLHQKLFYSWKQKIKKCTLEYDRIRYLTAKAMYEYNQNLIQQGKMGKLAHGTRSVLKLPNKDYFVNTKKIFADTKKLETFLGKEIVPKKIFKKIRFLHKKVQFWNLFQSIVGWGLVVVTFGIYWISWKKLYK